MGKASQARVGLPRQGIGDPLYPYIRPDELLGAVVELFAANPYLPQEILDLRARQEAGSEGFPFFDYLFVEATGSALGTEHKFLCCHRLRDAEERDSAGRALLGNEISQGDHG
jgi:hypothetical protein